MMLEGRLGEIARNASPFPVHLLREGSEGLCLFAARFWGTNDAIHMARNQMTVDLVDIAPRVHEMGSIYGCDSHQGDAWEFAESCSGMRTWDAVSVDTYTGDAMTRSMQSLELWCSLARDVVTATHTTGAPYVVPDGWKDWLFPRNERNSVNWLVLERA